MWLILVIISYLSGSIPFGLIIGKAVRGIDVREYGSGNIGATNVARVIGKKWGVIVFLADFFKGFLPLMVAFLTIPQSSSGTFISIALVAICGHNWSVFLKFKGGKGVSTSLGAISGLAVKYPPLLGALGVAVIAWSIVFSVSRYVSLASITASFCFCLVCMMYLDKTFKVLSVIIFFFIVIRHRHNIERLLQKKERRI